MQDGEGSELWAHAQLLSSALIHDLTSTFAAHTEEKKKKPKYAAKGSQEISCNA